MAPDIRDWRDIDASWLTAALATSGIDASVRAFNTKQVGTGQIGDCVRFELDYSAASPEAPRSVVGKFPSDSEESRQTGITLGNYYREVKFYQILQQRARIATPRCYFTDVEEETHNFVLIMEDLAPAEQGDQLDGIDLATTKRVLIEAAKLHAAFWEDDTLDEYAWVGGSKHAVNPVQPELVAGLWAGFVERYGSRVSKTARHIGDTMCANFGMYDAIRKGPRTLVHADYRPDNMLFATPAGGRAVAIVDWQSFGYGPGAADIGYCIAGALPVELRRAHEAELLATYTEELTRQGAGPYPRDDLMRHYVGGAF